MRMIRVFVYGTLLRGESNHHVVAPFLYSCRPGFVRGRLYDVGEYPALILDPDGRRIKGEWLVVSEDGLRAMDRLEGYAGPGRDNDYDRVWVRDESGEPEGWVYVWHESRGCPEIAADSWLEHIRGKRAEM